jgi:short-subunit dehydrogenase
MSRDFRSSCLVLDRYADRWALVTGASSGIGKEFAQRLAALGMHLVLTARREDEMRQLADDLDTRHGTQCVIIPLDLSVPGNSAKLVEEIANRQIDIELLINNAGFAVVGTFPETDVARINQLVQLNVAAMTDLTYRLAALMVERGHGGIINVASNAAFQPVAFMAAYSASKSFILHFSEALWAELRDFGVTVHALCPGPTETEFFNEAGVPEWLKSHSSHTVEEVVKHGLRSLEKKKQYTVVGWKNYLVSLLSRFAPRKMVVNESRKYFRPRSKSKKKKKGEPDQDSSKAEPEETADDGRDALSKQTIDH